MLEASLYYLKINIINIIIFQAKIGIWKNFDKRKMHATIDFILSYKGEPHIKSIPRKTK